MHCSGAASPKTLKAATRMLYDSVSLWSLILASAGVAAVVSSSATLLGQALERRARRRELLLTKAIELARDRRQQAMALAAKAGGTAILQDNIVSAETYYQWLTSLFESGRLPDDPRIQRI